MLESLEATLRPEVRRFRLRDKSPGVWFPGGHVDDAHVGVADLGGVSPGCPAELEVDPVV